MAIDRMKKVAIYGMSEEFSKIAHGLQRLSMLHIANIETLENVAHGDGGEELKFADKRLNQVEAALEALKPHAKGKNGFLNAKPQLTESKLKEADNEQNWKAVETILALSQKLPMLRSHRLQLQNALEVLRPYEKLAVRVSDIRSTRHVFMALGTVPEAQFQQLLDESEALEAVVQPIEHVKDLHTVFVATHQSKSDEVMTLLRSVGFADANLPVTGTVREEQEKLHADIQANEMETSHIEKAMMELSEHQAQLQLLYDYCNVTKQRAALDLETGHTGKAFYLTGWVRERQAASLADRLNTLSEALIIDFPAIKEDEMPPTAMTNSKLLKPFEAVTNMYSAPIPYEADPTFVMAPFFLCFFGMMVSDAAYGIILTVVSLLMLKLLKPTGMMGQIMAIVAMGGVATLFWGAMLGGWFGEALIPALWFNPLDNPILMLVLCLGLGLLHITVGILMKAKALIKEHKYIDVIFDCGFILCVLWGAVAAFAGVSFGLTIVLVGILGIFLTAGRDRKGIVKKFIGGFSQVYSLSGYLSDILSYSRLFGMGLATGIIAMVFNTIAGMMMGNPIGMVFAVIVLLVGHTFNISVNALGAYVHSSRLQYIEFYNKFYEGGGRAFVPYTFKTKYIQLVQG